MEDAHRRAGLVHQRDVGAGVAGTDREDGADTHV